MHYRLSGLVAATFTPMRPDGSLHLAMTKPIVRPTTVAATTQEVVPPPQPIVTTPAFHVPLRAPAVKGTGISDAQWNIPLAARDCENVKNTASIAIVFPNGRSDYACKWGDLSGTLIAERDQTPGFSIRWKEAG
jgi:hypothetical protein